MRSPRFPVRFLGPLLIVVLAGACVLPPPPSTGALDLGPLGFYGTGAPFSMIANIDHLHTEPEHRVRLSVAASNEPTRRGSLTLERDSVAGDVVMPAVGEYSPGVDGWSMYVSAGLHHQRYEVTSLSITELTYRAGSNASPPDAPAQFYYGVSRLRATFTFQLESGDEVQGSAWVN